MANTALNNISIPVFNGLQKPAQAQEESNYLTLYHGKATDSLARASSRDAELNPITGNATVDTGEVKVVMQKFTEIKGTLGVNTHKLLSVGIARFTELNNYSKKGEGKLEFTVTIPLREYASLLGYDVMEHDTDTPEEAEAEKKRASNALKDAKKKIRKDLDVLRSIDLTWEEKVKGKTGDFVSIPIIGSRGIKGNNIYMTFDPSMASYLAKLPLTQYPLPLLSVDARQSNAYSMGLKFSEHYNNDNNQKRGTANRLKVDTLLKVTSLPSYEDVVKTRKGWEERIKEPFETALDALTQSGILKDWRYTGNKGAELTDAEATPTDYESWSNLLIEFELISPVDHTERLERRAEEKKARAKKPRRKSSSKKEATPATTPKTEVTEGNTEINTEEYKNLFQ